MGKKILLADDSITIQKVIELTFSDEDFEVVTVGNGRLAVEKALEVRPDVVLCDIIMPEKDGYEVCEFIRKSPQLSHVPVLLLTGAFEPFDQERAARVGCDGFLAKPFEPETLIAKVKDLLSKAASRAPASGPIRPAPSGPLPQAPAATEAFVPHPPPVAAPPAAPPPAAPPEAAAPPSPPPPVASEAAPPMSHAPGIEPDVTFIPDEPFADLDADSFAVGGEAREAPSAPAFDAEMYSVAEELDEGPPELLKMTPEESETLSAARPDSSATVMFRADDVPWAKPAAELPPDTLHPGAAAPVRAEPARVPPPSPPTFEEVFEEEPSPAPAPASAPPAAASAAPPVPPPVAVARPPSPPAVPRAPAPTPPSPPPAAAAPAAAEPAVSFADVAPPASKKEELAAAAASVAAEVAVPVDMVSQIAQRVVAQVSEKVIRQIAWEVIPDLAEAMIKKEIERLKAELQQT